MNRLCDKCLVALRLPRSKRQPVRAPVTSPLELGREETRRERVMREKAERIYHDMYPSLEGLAQSVRSGCEFCALLRSAVQSPEVAATVKKTLRAEASPFALTMDLYYINDSTHMDTGFQEWFLCVELTAQVEGMITLGNIWFIVTCNAEHPNEPRVPPPIKKHALTTEPLSFMKNSLDECLKSCRHHSAVPPRFLPTRLIDVRSSDKLKLIDAVNIISNAEGDDTRYLTLSYCWGGAEQLKLSKDTRNRLTSGFKLGEMAPIQRDTVDVARALSIPYIWIDAICIIQDSYDDWAGEASQMDKIYAGSYVTVCALTASSCQEGFLIRDEPKVRIPTNAADGIGDGSDYYLQKIMWSEEDPIIQNWSRLIIDSSPWNQRAWTYQEQALSTRRIYFTKAGMLFKCGKNTIQSEYSDYARENDEATMLERIRNPTQSQAGEFYRIWTSHVMKEYSPRQITVKSDYLPALSGLAQIFAAVLGDDSYVAGLWTKQLLYGLLWFVRPQQQLAQLLHSLNDRHSSYAVPSWSWVGRGLATSYIDNGISPPESQQELRIECERLDASAILSSPDRFGQISEATLFVKGKVFPLSLGVHPLATGDAGGHYCLAEPGENGCFFKLDWNTSGDVKTSSMDDMLLVLLGSYESGDVEEHDDKQRHVFGLIIYPAETDGKYVRVGIFGTGIGGSPLDLDFFWRCETSSLEIV